MSDRVQQTHNPAPRPTPHGHEPKTPVATPRVHPFGHLAPYLVHRLALLRTHPRTPCRDRVAVVLLPSIGVFPLLPLLLLLLHRRVHRAVPLRRLLDRRRRREATVDHRLGRQSPITLFQLIK